jgi:pyruvate, orthophosphate dikinase
VRRHGGQPVHLFPAGRRHRLRSGLGRADLRPRAARHVRPGRRERLRPRLQRRRTSATATSFLQAERSSAYNFEVADTEALFRHFADAEAECGDPASPRARPGAAGLRPVPQGQPPVQPARRPRRDQRDRARRPTSAGCARWPRPAARPGSEPRAWLSCCSSCSRGDPGRMQRQAAEDLTARAAKLGGGHRGRGRAGRARDAAAPGLAVDGMPGLGRPDDRAARPAADAPEKAREGFLKSLGTADYRTRRDRGQEGPVLVATFDAAGPATAMCWPKPPRHPGAVPLAQVDALGRRRGALGAAAAGDPLPLRRRRSCPSLRRDRERQADLRPPLHGTGAIEVRDFADYRRSWRRPASCSLPTSGAGRSRRARALAEAAGCALREDPALLDELAGLVEWPVPLLGPHRRGLHGRSRPRCWSTTMRANQKYLALEDADGGSPRASSRRQHRGARWRGRDRRRQRAGAAGPALGRQVLLGPGPQDAARGVPAQARCHGLPCRARHDAREGRAARDAGRRDRRPDVRHRPAGGERAARLAKADLVSGMVGEFPEVQGIMGSYYARNQGEPEAVALAIAEHYRPLGPADACPPRRSRSPWRWPTSWTRSWAFSPPGSGPRARRTRSRSAAPRWASFAWSPRTASGSISAPGRDGARAHGAALRRRRCRRRWPSSLGFFVDRLKVQAKARGVRHDLIEAVFAGRPDGDLVRVLARVAALQDFLATADGANLLAAYKRAANIVRMTKWVYNFGGGTADGQYEMKELLGGKGANLAEMASLGLPVPPGFTITTEVCTYFYANDKAYPDDLRSRSTALAPGRGELGKRFGDPTNPLLWSRCARAPALSMPGMMDTVSTSASTTRRSRAWPKPPATSASPTTATAASSRCTATWCSASTTTFRGGARGLAKEEAGCRFDTELTRRRDWELVETTRPRQARDRRTLPAGSPEQLWGAIGAVFGSWMNRARDLPAPARHPREWGTAVNVQAMVFGNMGDDCATGVAFTRNPSTGENELLRRVPGQRPGRGRGRRHPHAAAPQPAGPQKRATIRMLPPWKRSMPESYGELVRSSQALERTTATCRTSSSRSSGQALHAADPHRQAHRAGGAQDRRRHGATRADHRGRGGPARRARPRSTSCCTRPSIPKAPREVIAKGLPASPGAASGKVVFTADDGRGRRGGRGVILVRIETSPEDIHGMHAAGHPHHPRRHDQPRGGGRARHGQACVCGAATSIDYAAGRVTRRAAARSGGRLDHHRRLDRRGHAGRVPTGRARALRRFRDADGVGRQEAPAEGAHQRRDAARRRHRARSAPRASGSAAPSTCSSRRSASSRARDDPGRTPRAGARRSPSSCPMQREDFVELFEIMAGLPVTIRLLDPPLHEFLPHERRGDRRGGQGLGVDVEAGARAPSRAARGQPDARAIAAAAWASPTPRSTRCRRAPSSRRRSGRFEKSGETVVPEVMIPLICSAKERVRGAEERSIDAVAEAVAQEQGVSCDYLVGTMIELPRAACAPPRSPSAEFFSFGTNDLTQTASACQRDDAGNFLDTYLAGGSCRRIPSSLDQSRASAN